MSAVASRSSGPGRLARVTGSRTKVICPGLVRNSDSEIGADKDVVITHLQDEATPIVLGIKRSDRCCELDEVAGAFRAGISVHRCDLKLVHR